MEFRGIIGAYLAQALTPMTGWRAFALLLAVAVAVRWQTFGNPVQGFDEQFYLVVGERWLDGAIPYVDIFDRKPIGLFLIAAFAAALPGDATLGFQGVALLFATATAFVVYRIASRFAGQASALSSGAVYLIWLVFMEGDGGQAQVFMNLLTALAALLVARCWAEPARPLLRDGSFAMAAIGIALQIKYSVVFEGLAFGLILCWLAILRHGAGRAATSALVWAMTALTPTVCAWAAFAITGHGDAWLFANFVSVLGKSGDALATSAEGAAIILAICLPLIAAARLGEHATSPERTFVALWAWAALVGMVAFNSYGSPHYALGLLVPLSIATAIGFDGRWRAWLTGIVLIGGFAGSQAVLAKLHYDKGGAADAQVMAAAARPHDGGCLYVYDGYPALYRLTAACAPTRYLFPGHLNMANEATVAALGVDPPDEARRVMASRPETVVIDEAAYSRGNRKTRAIVVAALARDYHLALRHRTGAARYRLVYRLNDRSGSRGNR